jgi:hypothetical protein
MAPDLPLRCRCGRVHGLACRVSANAGFRFVCYCKDCQAFARILGRPDILDAAGGTDIFQMPANRVKFTGGTDALRCLSLTARVLRWYADCCHTPIANTAAASRFPLVALIHTFMDCASDIGTRDALLGSPLCRIYEHSAIGALPPNVAAAPSLSLLARRATMIFGCWLQGLGRPNQFFDDHTGVPRSEPHLLTPSERTSAYQ